MNKLTIDNNDETVLLEKEADTIENYISEEPLQLKELKKEVTYFHSSLKQTSGQEFDDFWNNIERNNKTKVRHYDSTKPSPQEDVYFKNGVPPSVNVGDIITGKVVGSIGRDLIVNFGYKDNVYINIKQSENHMVANLHVNDEIEVLITEIKDKPYEIKGSISELIRINADNKLREFYKDNIAFEVTVRESIPAGFVIDIDFVDTVVQSFMPNTLAGVNRLTESQTKELVGQTIAVMLESVQKEKGVYVVSRRKYLNSLIPSKVKELTIGNSYKGKVTGKIDFGVFVEFNECLTGMIHETNLSEETKKSNIEEGMEIEFFLRDILKPKEGYKLILTQVQRPSIWDTIKNGQVFKSKVISIKPFGVLVKLDDDTTGLIQNPFLKKLSSPPSKGDELEVKVLNIIKEERKIYLDVVTK